MKTARVVRWLTLEEIRPIWDACVARHALGYHLLPEALAEARQWFDLDFSARVRIAFEHEGEACVTVYRNCGAWVQCVSVMIWSRA